MGNPWPNAFQTWMKTFLAGRQVAIMSYYTQTLHQIEITLSDMQAHAVDAEENRNMRQTWKEIEGLLPPAAFRFHGDYPR